MRDACLDPEECARTTVRASTVTTDHRDVRTSSAIPKPENMAARELHDPGAEQLRQPHARTVRQVIAELRPPSMISCAGLSCGTAMSDSISPNPVLE